MNILTTQTLSNEALQTKLDQAMAKPEKRKAVFATLLGLRGSQKRS